MTKRHITTRRNRASRKYRELHLQLMRECGKPVWWMRY